MKYKISKKILKLKVEIQWLLFKCFFLQRTIPCGRTKKDSYLCCQQPMKNNRVYFTPDYKCCYCKVCNSVRIMANRPINPLDPWDDL